MRGRELLDTIENLDPAFIKAAAEPPKRKLFGWRAWCAIAACVCLIIAAVAVGNLRGRGSGGDFGGFFSGEDGIWQEGIDPIVASLAVIPANVDLSDVADATCVSINEEDALNVDTLGNYIPRILPEGYWYRTAGYYETIMKDDTRYHMIRVTYESGDTPEESGESSSESTGDTAFLWMIWGHRPDSNLPVYQPEEVSLSLIDQQEGGVFYIHYDGIYVGIEQLNISTEDLLAVIKSIK